MSWLQTYQGRRFDPLDPNPDAIDILDIAHSLSNLCRFNGHCLDFYSVAEHCFRASFIVPPDLALAALLHDAPEAYLSDVVSPLKPHLLGFDAFERGMHEAIAVRFGIPAVMPDAVKQADLVMLATERRDLMAPTGEVWVCLDGIVPLEEMIIPVPHYRARRAFLNRFEELTAGLAVS